MQNLKIVNMKAETVKINGLYWGIVKFPGMTYKIGPYKTRQEALQAAQNSINNAAY